VEKEASFAPKGKRALSGDKSPLSRKKNESVDRNFGKKEEG
jgi:hypothetical protein